MKKTEKLNKNNFTIIGLVVLAVLVILIIVYAVRSIDWKRRESTDKKVVEDMTAASKVAMTCLAEGGSVSVAASDLTICDKSNVAGKWPKLGKKSTDGTNWVYAASGQAGDNKIFTAIATTSGTNPLTHTCTVLGCVKNSEW